MLLGIRSFLLTGRKEDRGPVDLDDLLNALYNDRSEEFDDRIGVSFDYRLSEGGGRREDVDEIVCLPVRSRVPN